MIVQQQQRDTFEKDGFVIVDSIIDASHIAVLHDAFEQLFHGNFETGVPPDEVNWQYETGDPSLTRQICNGWKANTAIARTVLSETLGQAIGALTGWTGVRIMIDNVLWKPPGAKSLGFHQDSAYLDWFTPNDLVTCWIALDDTSAAGGTMELVRGSHKWKRGEEPGEFHAPDDYTRSMRTAAEKESVIPDIVPVEVQAGGGSFHHGWVWHGSGENTSTASRRALVLHAMKQDVHYVPEHLSSGIGPIYSKYKALKDTYIPEQYFPVIWSSDGHRTPDLDYFLGTRQT